MHYSLFSVPTYLSLPIFFSFISRESITFVRQNFAQWRQLSVSLPREFFFGGAIHLKFSMSASSAINARISRVYVTNEPNSGKLSELLRYGDYAQSILAIALRET